MVDKIPNYWDIQWFGIFFVYFTLFFVVYSTERETPTFFRSSFAYPSLISLMVEWTLGYVDD